MPTADNSSAKSQIYERAPDAETLNRGCFCVTLDETQLRTQLLSDHVAEDLTLSHPHLFSHTSVFISPHHAQRMQRVIEVITQVVNRPEFSQQVLHQSPQSAETATPLGVFMGYDFHLSEHGPKLIEINTNAGGAFLNALLVDVQSQCCRSAQSKALSKQSLHQAFFEMFQNEWRLMRADKPLKTLAIVDVEPDQQYLYPEFKLAQQMFRQRGVSTIIIDPSALYMEDNILCARHEGDIYKIDMVYNRLTDFALSAPQHQVLYQAFMNNSAVITPNPIHHMRYADKRNLCVLSDRAQLMALGVEEADTDLLLESIPTTRLVESSQAEHLWAARKQLFFKPWAGFGSRAAYRGDKLTQRIWQEIVQGQYVAQQLIPPSERGILVDGQETRLKMDIRAYVYAGSIQLLAARLYQGQTTNFRTPGGGFAPVYIMSR